MTPDTRSPQELLDRLARLESRLSQMKRRMICIGIMLVCGMLLGAASFDEKTVEAHDFILRDSSGRIRARLSLNKGGVPFLAFFSAEDKNVAEIGQSRETGLGQVLLSDDAGKVRSMLGVAKDGTPGLWYYDTRGASYTPFSAPAARAEETRPEIRPEIHIDPTINLPPRNPKKEADLILNSIYVRATKENGKPWDAGDGAPDISICVQKGGLLGESVTTDTVFDSYSATYNKRMMRVKEGDTIIITVTDIDFAANDEIGTYKKVITAETIAAKTASWSFGQVERLDVTFEP